MTEEPEPQYSLPTIEHQDEPTFSGAMRAADKHGVPLIAHPDFDTSRLMLDEKKRPWFMAIPAWLKRKKVGP